MFSDAIFALDICSISSADAVQVHAMFVCARIATNTDCGFWSLFSPEFLHSKKSSKTLGVEQIQVDTGICMNKFCKCASAHFNLLPSGMDKSIDSAE